ncbi:MAG: archaetidylserine decarboxylase [Bdellovibrionaceae bacterium]|nr:archaetidylserine decarboxylase [Pseudobdellovibrionaceae bacterium]MDW8189904.1 archaetidylserine decarboxylase [Pseudobdellovibrionaceae bacterium]
MNTFTRYLFWCLLIVPKKQLSRWVGRLARTSFPKPFQEWLNRRFVQFFKINMEEAILKNPAHYPNLNALFTRKIDLSRRPLAQTPLVHPADSELRMVGNIGHQFFLQAKKVTYQLDDLIPTCDVQRYLNGQFILYYLGPSDYHRVHAPIGGRLVRIVHVPGTLWPVNAWSDRKINQVFIKNERVIFEFESEIGPLCLIMVGATNVGQISIASLPLFLNWSLANRQICSFPLDGPIEVYKGDELATFEMGSTVIMLLSSSFRAFGINVSPWSTPMLVKVRSACFTK